MNSRRPNVPYVAILAGAIIVLGTVLRVVMFLYNRDLWIDEASVARNVYERSFAGLAAPLDHFQYAPPVYLWIVKFWSTILGYSEYALRLHSLISGIGSLFLLLLIARRITTTRAILYPLFLLATGFIFLQYATELKQYMSDMFIALLLVWLALRTSIETTKPSRFLLVWGVAGSVAIWASMPSVFVLAGVGAYYALTALNKRQAPTWLSLMAVGIIWVSQFLVYYFLILKPQIDSDYLQNYHNRFFLFATPSSATEWLHNKDVIERLLGVAGGTEWYGLAFNLLLVLVGVVMLVRRNMAQAGLLLVPVVCMLCAAMLNQYSLIPRLTLFSMPLLFIVMAVAVEYILSMKAVVIKSVFYGIAICCAFSHQAIATLYRPYEAEEITRGLQFLKEQKIEGKDILVAVGANHAYLYYTQMHPAKEQWQSLGNATLMQTNSGFDSLAKTIAGRKAFLYTIVFDNYAGKKQLDETLTLTESFDTEGCHVYIYEPRVQAIQ